MSNDLFTSRRRTGSLGSGLVRRQPAPGDQLDLFAAKPDWSCRREFHEFTERWSASARLDGRYAGSLHQDDQTGKWRAYVSLGWRIYSMTGISSTSSFVGEFESFGEAEYALERAARDASKNPDLIWENKFTPENIRKAKRNGWWRNKS